MTFDNHDSRIRFFDLLMERKDLENVAVYELPPGYRFAFYQPGDRDAWIAIEQSARELHSYDQGVAVWQQYYGHVEDSLLHRMLFIEDEMGEKVATATAFWDESLAPELGQVHWVAVKRTHQGRGLARPLISRALQLMKEHGHTRAMLHTQTTTWVACRLYLDFGFRPTADNAVESQTGWRILRTLTNHPALSAFEKLDESEVCRLDG